MTSTTSAPDPCNTDSDCPQPTTTTCAPQTTTVAPLPPQSDTFLVRAKPAMMRYTIWNGVPYNDRWLTITPIDATTGQPNASSDVGMLDNGNGQRAAIRVGHVCLYGNINGKRTVNVMENIDQLNQHFDLVCRVNC